jgi:hypothetical protein
MNSAILIFSCDAYSDLWDPFFENFFSNWNQCEFPIYLLCNHKKYEGAYQMRVNSICVGDDISWSSNLKSALGSIREEVILTIFDDLFFSESIDDFKIKHYLKRFYLENMDYLRLNPTPKADIFVDDEIGIVKTGSVYRSSAVFAIWKKNVLMDLIKTTENAWQFEIYGSSRSDKYDRWYACNKFEIPFYNLVVKGYYEPFSYSILTHKGIKLSEKRMIMPRYKRLKLRFLGLRERIMYKLVPANFRRTFQQFFYKR